MKDDEIALSTDASISASVRATAKALPPEFIRLPRSGEREPITGLSRSTLNKLILPNQGNCFKPQVKSVCLRKRGAVRGTRLISRDSLINFLYGQEGKEKIQ